MAPIDYVSDYEALSGKKPDENAEAGTITAKVVQPESETPTAGATNAAETKEA
jgi:hypothetical protein